jgi:NADH-quinone oxidoreductase subunit A
MTTPLWPLAAFFILVVVLVGAILVFSFLAGERHRERTTGDVYESGIIPTGSAQQGIPIKYYLVAVAFVLFDLEAVYIFAWVAAFRETGWAGYFRAVIFIGILLAALIYFWRIGALDWAPRVWNGSRQTPARTRPDKTESEEQGQ